MSLKPNPDIPNDGLSITNKPLTPAQERKKFGDLLKPIKPEGKPPAKKPAPTP